MSDEEMSVGNSTASRGRLTLCRVVTVPLTFQTLLKEQLRHISRNGIDLTIVCSPGQELDNLETELGVVSVGISMERKPSPLADLRSLIHLVRFMRRNRFDVVHSSTPKAGLLTAFACLLSRAPVRLHTFTGQPWVELKGLRKSIPRTCDRITAKLMTHCYADSSSQRDFLIREGVISKHKISVIGKGSISGVDVERFSPKRWGGKAAIQTRCELEISQTSPVIAFLGRITRDKGIVELLGAFKEVSRKRPDVELLLVGPYEPERDPLPQDIVEAIASDRRVHNVGFTSVPEKFLGVAEIFCLPSYREGFGSVVIEAAAMGLPAVATSIVGLMDAVEDGKTGILVPPKTVNPLKDALLRLLENKELRLEMGRAARERAIRDFDSRNVNELVVDEYWRAKLKGP